MEKSEPEGCRVGANVDSNPSGGEPSTGRFISTRPAPSTNPSSFLHEHPRQSLCRSTFSPSSARGIKFGREAVSNILCSDSPIAPLASSRCRACAHRPLPVLCQPSANPPLPSAALPLRPSGASGWRRDEVYALNPDRLNDRLRLRFFDS